MLTQLGFPVSLGQTQRQSSSLKRSELCNCEADYFTILYDSIDNVVDITAIDNTPYQMSQGSTYKVKPIKLFKIRNVNSIESNLENVYRMLEGTFILQNTEFNLYVNLYGEVELEKVNEDETKECTIDSEYMKDNIFSLMKYWMVKILEKFEITDYVIEEELKDRFYAVLKKILNKTYSLFLDNKNKYTQFDISTWFNIIAATIGSCSAPIIASNGNYNNLTKNYNILVKLSAIDQDLITEITKENNADAYNATITLSDIVYETLTYEDKNTSEISFLHYLSDLLYGQDGILQHLSSKYTKLEFVDYLTCKLGAIATSCCMFECMNKVQQSSNYESFIYILFPLPQKYIDI